MRTAELKNDLHRIIVETNDLSILTQMREYFKLLITKNDDWWNSLSSEQKASINKGIEQLNNGEGIPHENVKLNIEKLLRKK